MTRYTDKTSDEALREQIMAAIGECKDDSLRAVLLLMLAVLDSIGRKIDAVMRDEKTIKEMVLNGDSASHHDDHKEWAAFRQEWNQLRPVIALMQTRHAHGGQCAWSAGQIELQKDDAKSRRAIRDRWLSNAAWGATLLIAGALAGQYFGK
jgi:hypothetical protein